MTHFLPRSKAILRWTAGIALVVLSLVTKALSIEPNARDRISIARFCIPDVPCAALADRYRFDAPGEAVLILANRGRFIPISPYSGGDSTDGLLEDALDNRVSQQKLEAPDRKQVAKDPWPGPPSAAPILECLPDLSRDSSLVVRQSRENVRIGIETLTDSSGEARFYPGVGAARSRKMHYKCTVVYDLVRRYSWPMEYATAESVTDVVYYDRDRLVPAAPPVPAAE